MTKKDLNPEAIVNELKGQSAFFKKGQSPTVRDSKEDTTDKTKTPSLPSSSKSKETPANEQKRTNVQTNVRSYERTDVRKEKRVKIRHAFDIYEDQLRDLQLIQFEAVRSDKRKPSLGEMVQEAIDNFLRTKKRLMNK